MEDITLQNNLTLEEKMAIPKLLGHDSINVLNNASILGVYLKRHDRSAEKIEVLCNLLKHIDYIHHAVYKLTQVNSISLSDSSIDSLLPPLGTRAKLITRAENCEEFKTEENTLYAALCNLARNAWQIDKAYGREEEVNLNTERVGALPEDILLVPEGSKRFKEYIKISFHNRTAFPDGKPLIDYVVRPAPRVGHSGFGLYFTGLASKVLRAPLDIRSNEVEGTTVSLYHPVYEKSLG